MSTVGDLFCQRMFMRDYGLFRCFFILGSRDLQSLMLDAPQKDRACEEGSNLPPYKDVETT